MSIEPFFLPPLPERLMAASPILTPREREEYTYGALEYTADQIAQDIHARRLALVALKRINNDQKNTFPENYMRNVLLVNEAMMIGRKALTGGFIGPDELSCVRVAASFLNFVPQNSPLVSQQEETPSNPLAVSAAAARAYMVKYNEMHSAAFPEKSIESVRAQIMGTERIIVDRKETYRVCRMPVEYAYRTPAKILLLASLGLNDHILEGNINELLS